ncbi:FIST signal transduction protein [Candidatus Microthrix parvicella]|uniref:FIST signal transduction protein n=1 Tax=Candidatus Neomicrothrix parvicella TaxID=41950 RepID=UPI00036F3003|nr:FIST C-terminal domain-containing protein [Candidatus Microthrix parvicella]
MVEQLKEKLRRYRRAGTVTQMQIARNERRFAAAGSEHPLAPHAVGEVCGQISDLLGPGPAPDVVFVFCSGDQVASAEATLRAVDALLSPRICVGAASTGTLAGAREVEGRSSLSVWAARLGEAVEPVSFDLTSTDAGVVVAGTSELVDATGHLVVVGDPQGLPITGLLTSLAQRAPELKVLGGLAPPVGSRALPLLLEGTAVRTGGMVGVRLAESVPMTTLVAQGCRPVGDPMAVTGTDGTMLTGLAGRKPMDRIRELAQRMDPDDRELASGGLHLGVVVDEHRLEFGHGDFVIRSVMGADVGSGALAMGEPLPLGTTVQFQVSDPTVAEADLAGLAELAGRADAALVFACSRRGVGFFGEPHHDASQLADTTGASAIAGMFCAGEIGPIGGVTRVHSLSAAVALFRDG